MWNLAPFCTLLPEKSEKNDHLLLIAAYKEKLIETFKSILFQNRETNDKSLGGIFGGSDSVDDTDFDIYPKFYTEPFATFYVRTARTYRFCQNLKSKLDSTFQRLLCYRLLSREGLSFRN